MSWLQSIVIAFVTGGLGLLCGGFIMNLCVRWYHVSSFEGKSGFAVVGMALLGGLAGLVIGLIAARMVAAGASPGFLKAFGVAGGSVLGIALLVLAVCRLGADLEPTLDGKALELEIEVRCPKSFQVPAPDEYGAKAKVYLPRGRLQPTGPLRPDEARTVDGQLIVPATVPLDTSSSQKFLSARFNKGNDLLFNLPLPGHPTAHDLEWSPWVESGWDAGTPQPPPNARFHLRYRVRTVEPPLPEPTKAEREADEAAQEQGTFDAIPSDAPLSAWLEYIQYGASDERYAAVVQRITAKPGWAAELGPLMVAEDARIASAAMYLLQRVPEPPVELVASVTAAGRALIAQLREVNALTSEQDPSYEGAAEVSIRFGGWMDAVRALREKRGGAFIPELREILELSRVRTDSLMLKDVRRIASYYAKEWAGLEPLPGDPPPR